MRSSRTGTEARKSLLEWTTKYTPKHAWGLEKGSVHLELRGVLGIEVVSFTNVAGDTDDFTPDGLTGSEVGGQTLSHDVNRAEIFSGQRLVDDEHRGLPLGVVRGEVATGEEWNAKRAEEVRSDAIGEGGLLGVLWISPGSLGGESGFGDFVRHREDQAGGSRRNAGSGANHLQDLLNIRDGG